LRCAISAGIPRRVGAESGAPKNPSWYTNLVTHPTVRLQDGATVKDFHAREVSGEERAAWWERAVAAYPPYAQYQQNTTRQIPVIILEPVS